MKSPYPEIIFHFVDKATALKGIVRERAFFPSYALERIANLDAIREFGCPMVSFCDLRLSELPIHMSKYGYYGIGLTKEWALNANLNPVAYVNKSSEFTNGLLRGIDCLFQALRSDEQTDYDALMRQQFTYMDTINTLRFIKNYEGILIRRNRKPRDYRFADEREWRHVTPHNTPGILPFLPANLMHKKAYFNTQLRAFRLTYTPTDVKYLIIPSEKNIPALRRTIESLQVSQADQNHLLARIITSEQIKSDF